MAREERRSAAGRALLSALLRRADHDALLDAVSDVRAAAWDEAYAAGVSDERTSQEYDGGRTPPARLNPYREIF